MFVIKDKLPERAAHEVHIRTEREMREWLESIVTQAVRHNMGFVFCEDVGASAPCIRFTNGRVVDVQRTSRA